jgi:hypothetical protein
MAMAMANRIRSVQLRDRSVAPAQAEVWVTVWPERLDAGTDLRGRLMGPRCAYTATVEVAYPLRPLGPASRAEDEAGALTLRVVIPEASLWEPKNPFLYEGPVELWQDGQHCDRRTVRHGLCGVSLGTGGLRVNGKPLALRGQAIGETPSEEQLDDWHREGVNLLIAPLETGEQTWERADRLGFFVLGRVPESGMEAAAVTALAGHPCCLGWLAPADLLDPLPADGLLGVCLDRPPQRPLPQRAQFIACPAGQAEALAALGRPLLVQGPAAPATGTAPLMGVVAE